jgi:hypothetical protein
MEDLGHGLGTAGADGGEDWVIADIGGVLPAAFALRALGTGDGGRTRRPAPRDGAYDEEFGELGGVLFERRIGGDLDLGVQGGAD